MKHNYTPHKTMYRVAKTNADKRYDRFRKAEEVAGLIMEGGREEWEIRRIALDDAGLSFDVAYSQPLSAQDIHILYGNLADFLEPFVGIVLDHVWTCDPWVNGDPESGDGTRDGDEDERCIYFFRAVKPAD